MIIYELKHIILNFSYNKFGKLVQKWACGGVYSIISSVKLKLHNGEVGIGEASIYIKTVYTISTTIIANYAKGAIKKLKTYS